MFPSHLAVGVHVPCTVFDPEQAEHHPDLVGIGTAVLGERTASCPRPPESHGSRGVPLPFGNPEVPPGADGPLAPPGRRRTSPGPGCAETHRTDVPCDLRMRIGG